MRSTNHYVVQYERQRAKFAAAHTAEVAAGAKLFDVLLDSKDGLWHCHRAGCQDVAHHIVTSNVNAVETYLASNVDDLVSQIVDAEMVEMGYSVDDVKILPCCHKS